MSGMLRRETWVRAYIRAARGGDGSQCLGVVEERVLYGGIKMGKYQLSLQTRA